MATEKICQHCGKPIDQQSIGGLCPECMLKVGLGSGVTGEKSTSRTFLLPDLDHIATKFPQLEILELLGQGGMGAVYKARQRSLDRLVALKILPPQSGSDPGFAERFTREARALARLGHPNIVAVHEFGQVDGLHYFIMEYVDGANLRQIEQSGKLTSRQALEIIPQICEALQFAHDEGVVHRDIKPENVLLDKKGRVKIADFGLAKILGRDPQELRLTGIRDVMGTPHYMAPEQIEHPAEVDHRADIYSLGVVFYEMLTGELPLGKFAPPSRKVQVDVRLDEVVLHALEKEPALRYQKASQVKTDVEHIAVGPQAGATRPASDADELLRRPPGRRAVRAGGIVFAVVFGLAALVTGLLPREYQAVARIAVRDPKVDTARSDGELDWMLRETVWSLKSPVVLRRVVSDLDLRKRWADRYDYPELGEEQVHALLARQLVIERIQQTAIFAIRCVSQDRHEAVEIANRTAEVFCSGPFQQKAELIDRAFTPQRPIRPNVPLNLSIGALLGILLGAVTAAANWLRSSIQHKSGKPPRAAPAAVGASINEGLRGSPFRKVGPAAWVARSLALAGFVFILLFVSAEGFPPFWRQPFAVQVELLATVLMVIGLLVGWRSEAWGMLLIVDGWLLFLVAERGLPPGPFIAFLLPAALYGYSWYAGRRRDPTTLVGSLGKPWLIGSVGVASLALAAAAVLFHGRSLVRVSPMVMRTAAAKEAWPARTEPVPPAAAPGRTHSEATTPTPAAEEAHPPPPVVIKTVPESGSAGVDPALTELRATFSSPMQDESWSWTTLDQEHFPNMTGPPRLLDDGRTCLLPVKLEPGKVYATWLNSEKFQGFRDRAGRPAVPYLLIFETRK